MKRICLCVILVAATAGLVFAQGENRRESKAAPVKITISGALGVANGSIALKSGNDTYYVMGLDRFVGFIDGLKEGAQVSLEGYAFAIPQNNEGKVFRVTKLTLNGKDYDLDSGKRLAGHPKGFAGGPGAFWGPGNFYPHQGWAPGPGNAPGQKHDNRQRPQGNKFDNRRPGGRR
ncbi:hypothetical protein [Leadbettera azotonutricia]|uniref:DUF5666 domain-containing protein n=1 Tax=Leadbettera azotonutricia (strain ATCC BAA-888 / DSM 13862 / ZAS-9) TaxID=545695 RepID=F5YBB6_LEAAZ|nr:hypothetical protein [Leadbettera azotonutricia]AEF80831.1 hypothetical protein TREAZ_1894 [Leadbettera azotonutricia ZAS-9]